MRKLLLLLAATTALSGCATLVDGPPAMTREELVSLAKSGADPKAIIKVLHDRDTVMFLSASEIVALNRDGVPTEVLDYMQAVQMEEIRMREAMFSSMHYGRYWRDHWPPVRRAPRDPNAPRRK
jgi:hypothetical protein